MKRGEVQHRPFMEFLHLITAKMDLIGLCLRVLEITGYQV